MGRGKDILPDLLGRLFADLLDFIYPPHCGVCGRSLGGKERIICTVCWEDLAVIPDPFCLKCGIPLSPPGPLCTSCRARRHLFTFARAHGLFDNTVQKIIHLFKYGRKRSLAGPLAALMAETMNRDVRFSPQEIIVPVPLHPAKRRVRGYNQSELLARALSKITGLPLLRGVLVRRLNTPSQSQLKLDQRLANMHGAFGVKACGQIEGRRILLVDDVLTTGSTADACAAALLDGGAAEVCVITVARVVEPEPSVGT